MALAKGTPVTITTHGIPFLSQFDGLKAKADGVTGASGKTERFDIDNGRGIYLETGQYVVLNTMPATS